MSDRSERLRELIGKSPRDPFPRYGLAMELKKQGKLEEAARQFEELLGLDPTYLAAYYQYGTCLAGLDRKQEARQAFSRGMEAALEKGDLHARGELEAALNQL